MKTFVLIHSPLVGPFTWALTADELRRKGVEAVVPTLTGAEASGPPYWRGHAEAVARALEPVAPERPLILVGHSGAGPLLPATRQIIQRRVAAYIFVDAFIPRDGASRRDLFESHEGVAQFRQAAADGLLPTWSEEDLRDVIPDPERRRRFAAELRPLPLAVYEEPLPVFAGWPDAPCGYLQFSPIYDTPARHAQDEGWAYMRWRPGIFTCWWIRSPSRTPFWVWSSA